VNIGGDYEIGRSVRLSVVVCVCLLRIRRVIHNRQERWRPPVKTFILAEIMHSHERSLVYFDI